MPDSTHTVTLVPSGRRESFLDGTPLIEALLTMGIALKTPCGGKGICNRCAVTIEGMSGEVPACRTSINSDLTVHASLRETENIAVPVVTPGGRISFAVDIGTTTVKMALVDVTGRASLEVASFFNPQHRFGHDVISRIAAASDAVDLMTLRVLIRQAIDIRLDEVLKALNCGPERIEGIVLTGNTTMLYLLFGLDVAPLGRYPYIARTRDFPEVLASEVGLCSAGPTRVQALPVLGAFLGADLVGGLALCHDRGISRNALFIDLGTNGELFVLNGKGGAHAASCAMGPALEGMNISWGMAAESGAITRIEAGSGGLAYRMIGDGEPAGITGTALVDLVAILLDAGVIAQDGAFVRAGERNLPNPAAFDRNGELTLWGAIRLTQKDVRNVQLAKAASLTASHFLLEAAGCSPEDIGHVLIAGAFGENLDLGHFRRLGFLQNFPNASYAFLGNTSLKAAEAACMDPGFPGRSAVLRDNAREVELSTRPGFQNVFIRSLDFPAGRSPRPVST